MRFVEVPVNGPKSWSLAAELHLDVAAAYDAAQDRAAETSWLRWLSGKGPRDLVFIGAKGAVLRLSHFRRSIFIPAVEATGRTGLTPHGLRPTAASLAIASGADVKVVQTMLGHASATMTLDLYGHLYADRLDEIADRMDAARTAHTGKSWTSAQDHAQDHADFCGLTAS